MSDGFNSKAKILNEDKTDPKRSLEKCRFQVLGNLSLSLTREVGSSSLLRAVSFELDESKYEIAQMRLKGDPILETCSIWDIPARKKWCTLTKYFLLGGSCICYILPTCHMSKKRFN